MNGRLIGAILAVDPSGELSETNDDKGFVSLPFARHIPRPSGRKAEPNRESVRDEHERSNR